VDVELNHAPVVTRETERLRDSEEWGEETRREANKVCVVSWCCDRCDSWRQRQLHVWSAWE